MVTFIKRCTMEMTSKHSTRPLRSRTRQLESLRRQLLKARTSLLDQALDTCQRSCDQGPRRIPSTSRSMYRRKRLATSSQIAPMRSCSRLSRPCLEYAASYGVCRDCGENIPVQRLKVQPETIYCVECKERIEHSSSLRGMHRRS